MKRRTGSEFNRNRIQTARKFYWCDYCETGSVHRGDPHQYEVGVCMGNFVCYRKCQQCLCEEGKTVFTR